MELLILIIGGLVLLFGSSLLFGAPYLPTLYPQIEQAFDMLALKSGQTVLEIGAGDGRVLAEAGRRGLKGIGYEVNPLLVIIAWIRLRKYRGEVRVVWANAVTADWPIADGAYVFGIAKIMPKLDKKFMQYSSAKQRIRVVSYGFPVQGRKAQKSNGALFLYQY